MSTYIYSYDDEAGTDYTEIEIDYDFYPGYWDYMCPEPSLQYWVSSDIHINHVRVLSAEYYDRNGNTLAKIKREDMNKFTRDCLDETASEYVITEVTDCGRLAELLVENDADEQ